MRRVALGLAMASGVDITLAIDSWDDGLRAYAIFYGCLALALLVTAKILVDRPERT